MDSQSTVFAKSVLQEKHKYKVLLNILVGLILARLIIFFFLAIPSLINAKNTVGLILGVFFVLIYAAVAIVWIFLLRKPYKWAYIVFIILSTYSLLSSMQVNAKGFREALGIGGGILISLFALICAYVIYRGIFPKKEKAIVQSVDGQQVLGKPKEE